MLQIYATSIDYDPSAEASQRFFATVQNKMHWAAHGHTAAEVIAARADADQPNMGLSTWAGAVPRKTDVAVARNYLAADELDALNRIVSACLEFAELQALGRRTMHMADWIAKLDEFLRLGERDILEHAGKASHRRASGARRHDRDWLARPGHLHSSAILHCGSEDAPSGDYRSGPLARTLDHHALVTDEGRAVLDVVQLQQYARSWRLLLEYDEDRPRSSASTVGRRPSRGCGPGPVSGRVPTSRRIWEE